MSESDVKGSGEGEGEEGVGRGEDEEDGRKSVKIMVCKTVFDGGTIVIFAILQII